MCEYFNKVKTDLEELQNFVAKCSLYDVIY